MAKKKKDKEQMGLSITTISLVPRGLPSREGDEPPTGPKDSVIRKSAISRIMEHFAKGGLYDTREKGSKA